MSPTHNFPFFPIIIITFGKLLLRLYILSFHSASLSDDLGLGLLPTIRYGQGEGWMIAAEGEMLCDAMRCYGKGMKREEETKQQAFIFP